MSIPNVGNHVMTLSEEKGNTHTLTSMHVDTLLVFTLATPSSAPQQTAGLWGVLTGSVYVRVCMCVCSFYPSTRPSN